MLGLLRLLKRTDSWIPTKILTGIYQMSTTFGGNLVSSRFKNSDVTNCFDGKFIAYRY